MANDYQQDGDMAFVGLNSRDNPASLSKGIVSQSQNFRLDRGVATVRKGLQRKTASVLENQQIFGSGVYLDSTGQEIIIIVIGDGLYTYNPQTDSISSKVNFPEGETIDTTVGCTVVSAVDNVYISRGHDKRPLKWDLQTTITAFPTTGTGSKFPNCIGLIYYCNRMIAIGQTASNGYISAGHPRVRDTVCVSNYLDFDTWDDLDAFTFNQGSNDEVVSVAPWTLNEFVVFMRNSIFYVNIGLGRYITGDALANDCFVKTLVNDIGCVANSSVVQADGGIIFLSDTGVYFMQPSQVGSNESMRLLTQANPLSAPINDVIQRINRIYASGAVATYWNGRYYLAVPLDNSVDNNAVLVYNFILKQWESVDLYPSSVSVVNTLQAYRWIGQASPSWESLTYFGKNYYLTIESSEELAPLQPHGLIVGDKVNMNFGKSYKVDETEIDFLMPNGTYLVVGFYDNGISAPFDDRVFTIEIPESAFVIKPSFTENLAFLIPEYGDCFFAKAGSAFVKNLLIAKKDKQRRLFYIDQTEGVFLMEELDYDEFGQATGTPILPFRLPAYLSETSFQSNQISSVLKTRSYVFNSYSDKRFTNAEINYNFSAGGHIQTYADISNNDSIEHIDNYGSQTNNDETRRVPIRKYGTSMQLRFITDNLRPSIRSAFIYATQKVKNLISKK